MSLASVRWIEIPYSEDARGVLSVIESALVGFPMARVFYMHRVPPGVERGGHAHPHTDQVLVPLAGRLRVDVSDGVETQSFLVDDINRGLYLPRMTWTRLYDFSADSVTLSVCNTAYVPGDVIRTFPAFLARMAGKPS